MLTFPKPPSRAAEKRERTQAKALAWRLVCALVNQREKYCCRSCDRAVPPMQRHHHHLKFRSRGGSDTVSNTVLLCPICHADIHGYRLSIKGEDANGQLRFVRSSGG